MTFAVAGASGKTGQIVAETLLARGERIRVLVRDAAKGAPWKARGAEVAVADLADPAALTQALRGTKGAYLLVPPSFAPGYRAHQDVVSQSLAAAVKDSGVPHVVLLSSIGAQHPAGSGPIAGLHLTETLLGAIPSTRLTRLRAAYFLENVASSLGAVRGDGVLPSFFPASLAFPMTSSRDIGELAAQLLLDAPPAPAVVDLGSDVSHETLANAFAALLGKTVSVAEAPVSAMVPTLEGFGFPSDLAALYAEMTAGIISGHVAFQGGDRRVENRQPLERVLAGLLA